MLGMDFSTVLTRNLRNPRDYAPLRCSELSLAEQWCLDRV